jgi:hypothetical protein
MIIEIDMGCAPRMPGARGARNAARPPGRAAGQSSPGLANVDAGRPRSAQDGGMVHRATRPRQSLGPADLAAAVTAFEAGLHLVDAMPDGARIRELREDLARHVIEHALSGERDAAALTSAAVRFVASDRIRRRC